jgi:mono/diheme cytochrome c family protein
LLALVCFSGCGGCGGCSRTPEGYSETVTFPARTDWVVVELPKQAPDGPDPQWEIEEAIRRINDHGGKVLDPATVPPALRDELNQFLRDTFGTPGKPTIGGDDETKSLAKGLGLTDERLAAGSKLFRDRCQECHGLAGDGRGPTGQWVTPHPRDFRAGGFKFTSTGKKPTRADLFRTITNGLKPTAMPSFGMRTEEERNSLIDYVMYLSIRGKTELDVLRTLLVHGEDGLSGDVPSEAATMLKRELHAWTAAESQVIPANPPESSDIRRGHALFVDSKGGACTTCHVNYGRDGKFQYDIWGTRLKPGDLTEIRRKGGDGLEQLFRRIRGGIPPANMPAATSLTDAQVWDIVFFLKALPYPDRLPSDVRANVYGDNR